MNTKYLITCTDPDSLADEDNEFEEDTLECCQVFTSKSAAEKEFKSLTEGRTNMRFHLLKVEHVRSKNGYLK